MIEGSTLHVLSANGLEMMVEWSQFGLNALFKNFSTQGTLLPYKSLLDIQPYSFLDIFQYAPIVT